MATMFIKITPPFIQGRVQRIEKFLNNPDVTFTKIGTDGHSEFGKLTCDSTDVLADKFQALQGMFSAVQMTEKECVGACRYHFNEYSGPTEEPAEDSPEYPMWIAPENRPVFSYEGWTEEQLLDAVREYKKTLMKEVVNGKLYASRTPDSVADLTKIFVLLNTHYDDLTVEQKSTVDGMMDRLKNVYNVTTCMNGMEEFVSLMENILGGYYSSKSAVENAETVSDIKLVDYE